METQQLIKHQVRVEIIRGSDGVVKIVLPDKSSFDWPVDDASLMPGQFYITLSQTAALPDKQELARMVLKEILQNGQ